MAFLAGLVPLQALPFTSNRALSASPSSASCDVIHRHHARSKSIRPGGHLSGVLAVKPRTKVVMVVGAAKEEFVDEEVDRAPEDEKTKAQDPIKEQESLTPPQDIPSACEEGAKAEGGVEDWAAIAAVNLLLHPYGAAHPLEKLGESAKAAAGEKVEGAIEGASHAVEEASTKVLLTAEEVKAGLETAVEGVIGTEAPSRKDPLRHDKRGLSSAEALGKGVQDLDDDVSKEDIRAEVSGDLKGPVAVSTEPLGPSFDTFAEGVTTAKGGLGQQVQGLAENLRGGKGEVAPEGGGTEGEKEGEEKHGRKWSKKRLKESVARLKKFLTFHPKTE